MAIRTGKYIREKYDDVVVGIDTTGAPALTGGAAWDESISYSWTVVRDSAKLYDTANEKIITPTHATHWRMASHISIAADVMSTEMRLDALEEGAVITPRCVAHDTGAAANPRRAYIQTPWMPATPGNYLSFQARTDGGTPTIVQWWITAEFLMP